MKKDYAPPGAPGVGVVVWAPNTGTVLALRPHDAARAIGISRTKLFALIQAGELETALIGKTRLVPVASLSAFLAARTEAK